jgi:hypothetical protein
MSQSYADYQKRAAERAARQAQGENGEGKTYQKVGFFKLPGDGDVALVRINVTKPEDLMLADYHQLDASTKFMKVECTGVGCPFCKEAEIEAKANKETGAPVKISKAKARVFLPMVVAYRQPDGTYSQPEVVIFDAPAAGKSEFVQPIVDKLVDFGPLTNHVFKLTRHGLKLDTKYALDYVPTFDNDSIVPNDFSAFTNFRIDKHSYWVKTNADMENFLSTGTFPAAATTTTATTTTANTTVEAPTAPAAETTTTPAAEAQTETTPRRNPNFQAHW